MEKIGRKQQEKKKFREALGLNITSRRPETREMRDRRRRRRRRRKKKEMMMSSDDC